MYTTPLPNSCHDELPEAIIKSSPADFCVDEDLGFDPAGDGEHLWIQLRKTGWNTRDVIELIAAELSLGARDIGYSGLKDKNAVTTQWLSVPLAGLAKRQTAEQIVEQTLHQADGLSCLRVVTGQKKLKTGTHRHNRFKIVLRGLSDSSKRTERHLQQLASVGFPNYFGAQRFGHQGQNLARAVSMFSGRKRVAKFKRGIYLSAARAQVFNQLLADRVSVGSWNKITDGELCILDGSNSVFSYDGVDESIHQRCDALDIHPSGPMHGRGEVRTAGEAAALEKRILMANSQLAEGLEKAGLKAERRALRAVPQQLGWQWTATDALELDFTLRRGVYATSLLAELANVTDAGKQL
jgi:tRNA pseudouridine13 synthase